MSNASPLREADGPRPRAVILAVQLPDVDASGFESSLTELERLANTLGLDVIGRVTQKRAGLVVASVVGAGKLKQLAAFTGGKGELLPYEPPGKKKTASQSDSDADSGA